MDVIPHATRRVFIFVGFVLPQDVGETTFKINLFRNAKAKMHEHFEPAELDEPVAIGDVIRLFHSETEGYLCAAGDASDKRVCVHTPKPDGERNSNQLFAVANPDPSRRNFGAFLESGDTFRLLNLASSLYLAVDPQESSDRCLRKAAGVSEDGVTQAVAYPMRLVDPDNPRDHKAEGYSFFTLDKMAGANVSSQSNVVNFGKFFGLRCTGHTDYSVRVSAAYNTPETPQYLATYTSDLGTAVRDTAETTERILVHAYKETEVDQEHVFRISRADHSFQSDVMFATSMVHYLDEFTDYISPDAEEDGEDEEERSGYDATKDMLRLKKVDRKAAAGAEPEFEYVDELQRRTFNNANRSLRRLILACTESDEKDLFKREGKPRIHQQRLFLNQGVTQAALALMSTMAVTNGLWKDMSKLATDPAYKPAFEIASLCWRFIRQACLQFPRGGTHTVRTNLSIMIAQVPYGIRVMDTLVEVFNDNVQLNKHMDSPAGTPERQQLFKFAIDYIRDIGPVDKFLTFLANLCSDTVNSNGGSVQDDELVRYESTCIELLHLLQHGDPFEAIKNEQGQLTLRPREKSKDEIEIEEQLAKLRERAAAGESLDADGNKMPATVQKDMSGEPTFRIGNVGSGTNAFRMFTGTGGKSLLDGDTYTVPSFIQHDFSKKPETLVVVYKGVRYPVKLRTHIKSVDEAVAAFHHQALDIFMQTRLKGGIIEINARGADENYENWVRLSDLPADHGFDLPSFFLNKIQNKNPEPPKPTLTYHIATLRLLTMLCVEENIESLRKVYSVDELLAGMSDEEQQNYEVRASYTDLLGALYIPPIPEVSTLVKWYYSPDEDTAGHRSSKPESIDTDPGVRLLERDSRESALDSAYSADGEDRYSYGARTPSTPQQDTQAASDRDPWQPITTPDHKKLWLNTQTGETSASHPEHAVSSDLTAAQLERVYGIIMAALNNRCTSGKDELDELALMFIKELLQNLGQLLNNEVLQAMLTVEILMDVEDMLQTLLTKLHSILMEHDPTSQRVQDLVSPFTEICKVYKILTDLALNDYVNEFCRMYGRVKTGKVSALAVHEELSTAWPTRVDGQLRDELTDLLIIDDDFLRNNVVAVLGKLHDRHDDLIKAITALVFVGDLPQASFVRSSIEEITDQIRPSLVSEGAQRSVGFINSLTSLMVEGSPGRSVKQHLQRQLGVHSLVVECVLSAERYRSALKERSVPVTLSQVPSRKARDDATVVRATFRLLENFCSDNPKNQMAVAELFDSISHADWELFMGADLGMAEACTAVYRANTQLCKKFDNKHIKSLVIICSGHVQEMAKDKDPKSQLKTKGVDKTGEAYVALLRTLTVVDGVPIPHNQDRVLKAFIELRERGMSICLDPEFWVEEADDERHLRLPSLIDAGKPGLITDRRMTNARLDYHIEMVRLMSSCAVGDEACSRKLRMLFPIQLVASAVDSEGLIDEVRSVYLNFFDVLFVKPCATQPGFARELYLARVSRDQRGNSAESSASKDSINPTAVKSLVDVLRSSVRWLTGTTPNDASAPVRLFPRGLDRGGGAVSFVASLFDCKILESLEEYAGTQLEDLPDAREIFDESHSVSLLQTLGYLMKALLNSERDTVKLGLDGPAVNSPLHIVWMDLTRHLIASLKASSHFDRHGQLLADPKVETAGKGKMPADKARANTIDAKNGDASWQIEMHAQFKALVDRLDKVAVSIHADDTIGSFDEMVELASCAWGDEFKRDKFIWAKHLHTACEKNWHQMDSLSDDQFKLRRYLADIMAKSIATVDDGSVLDKKVTAAAPIKDAIAIPGAKASTGYTQLETSDALALPADGTSARRNKRRSVFFMADRYGSVSASEKQEDSRERSYGDCRRLTQAIIRVAETSLGTSFSDVAGLLFACINGAVLRASEQQQQQQQAAKVRATTCETC